MANALVTGATGFIGKHLVRALRDAGHEVTCFVRASSRTDDLAELGVEFAVGDVNDAQSFLAPCAAADWVFHLAAMLKQPWHPEFMTTNAEGAGNVARACAAAESSPVLVAVSSMAAAGPSGEAPIDERHPPAPVSRYGKSKLLGEHAVIDEAARVPTTLVRPPIVLGPGDTAALPMFRAAARGVHLAPADGRVSIVDVRDLATLLIAAAERGERVETGAAPGRGIYFAGHDEYPTIAELGPMIGDALGKRVRVVRPPAAVVRAAGALGEAVARATRRASMFNRDKVAEATAGSWMVDTTKAREQLGWQPAAPLATRVAEVARWYRDNDWL